ncbi:MAG: hypothetical protein JWM43_2669 [Acidobacteriaceae bacterium]|nr:hypothetical protein [Acidobacteriaceae bacterium]
MMMPHLTRRPLRCARAEPSEGLVSLFVRTAHRTLRDPLRQEQMG